MMRCQRLGLFVSVLLLLFCHSASALTFSDATGRSLTFDSPPQRIVSLVPSFTEALFAMGAGDQVVGVTLHDTWPSEAATKAVMGGFLKPDPARILAQKPDMVIVSALQKGVITSLSGQVPLVQLEISSVKEAFKQILLLGRITGHEIASQKIVAENQKVLSDIAAKVAKIPMEKRKRVMRLMGRHELMTPGSDSFQQELIALAGGIAHKLPGKGEVIHVSDEDFISFAPDVLYGCGDDRKLADGIKNNPAFGEVPAVKHGRFDWYPCALTCRASVHTGYFVSWLAANLYSEAFSIVDDQVHPNAVFERKPIDLPLEYVEKAELDLGLLYDFPGKSVVVDFKHPQTILSTLDGWQEKISTIGNHYIPPQCWRLLHEGGFEGMKRDIFAMVGRNPVTSRFLYTGADMEHYAVKTVSFKEMSVTAVATAGVHSNAMRMGKDTGDFYEPGTINILILPNVKLSHRAMSRAIISATEGKTAALQDLDVRSSYTPKVNPATGTGTDNIILAEGQGVAIDNAGGHSKMGELVARAVYGAVKDAVFRQNGLIAERLVFRRLEERKISLADLVDESSCPCRGNDSSEMLTQLESLLLRPRYASFVLSAMAISDAHVRGLVTDLSAFEGWCRSLAQEIAGKKVPEAWYLGESEIPEPLALALNALMVGAQL